MRPLDNPYLERALFSSRIASGQIILPKTNAMFSLERLLRKGKSIGMLPDQSTSRGLRVKFFGANATVTPIPALLAMRHGRPVVVVAACRTDDPYYFEGTCRTRFGPTFAERTSVPRWNESAWK